MHSKRFGRARLQKPALSGAEGAEKQPLWTEGPTRRNLPACKPTREEQ